jgi:sterol desaturase/sphingolipid hydroxylase (fatty acid hydroxylase superfamily)
MLPRRVAKFWRELDAIDRLSLPLFAVTIVAEHVVLKRIRQTSRYLRDNDVRSTVPVGYERRDTAASLAMLVGSVAANVTTMAALGRLDRAVFKRRVSNVGSRRGSFVTALVLWDVLYYSEHRAMHEVRLFWANHVTHHSSQRYNLSTALRQPWSSYLMAWAFAPMPLLGFSSAKIRRAAQLNLLYQYWVHTEAVDRLPGWFEAVFNTPSHHRVHHGANQQYLDKNYGGILIVWDKLFGTFEPEDERVRYGLTKNITTFNPLRIAYHEFALIGRDVVRAKSWRHRAGYVLRHPGWTPERTSVAT